MKPRTNHTTSTPSYIKKHGDPTYLSGVSPPTGPLRSPCPGGRYILLCFLSQDIPCLITISTTRLVVFLFVPVPSYAAVFYLTLPLFYSTLLCSIICCIFYFILLFFTLPHSALLYLTVCSCVRYILLLSSLVRSITSNHRPHPKHTDHAQT